MEKTTTKLLSGILALSLTFILFSAWADEHPAVDGAGDPIPDLDCVIEPSDIVDLGSAVSGVVESILVDRSDPVKKGAVIATLESSVEQAALDLARARAELNTAIDLRRESATFGYLTLKRNRELSRKSVIPAQDIDQIRTETRIAELQVRQEEENKRIAELERYRAQAKLERRTLRSPVNGVVMDRYKSVGEYLEDEPVLRLARLDPLNVEVVVPVDYLGRITPGMQAEVTAVVPGSDTHRAAVQRVDVVADAASGTYGVRLTLPNPDHRIPAGLRCRLVFLPQDDTAPDNQAGNTDTQLLFSEEREMDSGEVSVIDSGTVPPDSPKSRHPGEGQDPGNSVSNVKPAIAGTTVKAASGQTAATIDHPGACYTVGPVSNKTQALQISDSMAEWVDELAVRNQSVREKGEFIVLAAQQPDRPATHRLIARLQKAGVSDMYLFKRGPNRGRVSLGLYKTRRFAVKRQNQLSAKGFQTDIGRRHRKTTAYWLDFSLKTGATLPKLKDGIRTALVPSLSFEPVACPGQLVQR